MERRNCEDAYKTQEKKTIQIVVNSVKYYWYYFNSKFCLPM